MYDFHIHSNYRPSDDGSEDMSVANIVRFAESNQYSAIGISPHIYKDESTEKLEILREQITTVNTHLRIFLGAEANVLDKSGSLSISEDNLRLIDYLIAAPGHFNMDEVEKPPRKLAELIDYQHEKIMNTVDNPQVNIIAHPYVELLLLTYHKYLPDYPVIRRLKEFPESYIREFARKSRENNVIIEVNGYFVCEFPAISPDPSRYLSDMIDFLSIIAEEGASVIVNSDAHKLHQLNYARYTYLFMESTGIKLNLMNSFLIGA